MPRSTLMSYCKSLQQTHSSQTELEKALQIKLRVVMCFVEGKYKIQMLQGSLPGCWQLFYLDWVVVVHNFVKVHRARHNFHPRGGGRRGEHIIMLA